MTMGNRMKAYFYSALAALFFFVILRQIGLIEQHDLRDENLFRGASNSKFIDGAIRSRGMNSRKAFDFQHYDNTNGEFTAVTPGDWTSTNSGTGDTVFRSTETRQDVTTYSTTTQTNPTITGAIQEGSTATTASTSTSSQSQKQSVGEKPSVFTFFTGVQDRTKKTGMNAEADELLLRTWKQEWSRAGWNPVVLTFETAKQHPAFHAINAMLDGPFGEYDRFCFLRWLAVAVAGGGFAVDYDTFPLNFVTTTLPNGGKLTIHENSRAGGVPSLVSATAEEYTKFAWALATNLGHHKTETHWSDMKAMQDMYQKSNGTAYIMESNVLSAIVVLNGRGYDQQNCAIITNKYALHFSHHAIQFGTLPPGAGPKDRAGIGSEWLKGWRESCKEGKASASSSSATTSSRQVPTAATQQQSPNSAKPVVKATTSTVAKPPVYAFFTDVQNKAESTGMNDDADKQLLQAWKEEWSRAGWNPEVLSLDTARQHPDFQAINALLDGPFGEYDRYCFLRWLAIAVVGGGFAVDYDTLPLDFVMTTLPNGGKLTVHENSRAGGVPSLVSATADEYTKFAWALARNLIDHKTEKHWSDMKAMQDLYQKSNGTAYIMESNVLSALVVLNGNGYDETNCGILVGKYALHFSHHAIQFGKLRKGVGPKDRAGIGSEWLNGWRASCSKQKKPVTTTASGSKTMSSWFGTAKSAALPTTTTTTVAPAPAAGATSSRDAKSSTMTTVHSPDIPLKPTTTTTTTTIAQKPLVYTFFTGVQDRTTKTGMNGDADDQLLKAWKEEWSRAGWNPVVLTLETAKQHPDFQAIDAMLHGPIGEYDRYCFLRWLAVAVAGGGFAVDYDAFPLNFIRTATATTTAVLPNGGKLTVHENSRAGGVPSLVSATADEYTKFAWALAKNLVDHRSETHWSDMKAMQDMYQKTNGMAYIMESNVLSAVVVLNGRGYDDHNCGILVGKYALHFSHHAIQFGKLRQGAGPKDRAGIAREWLKGWQESCKTKR